MKTHSTDTAKSITLNTLRELKAKKDKISCIALYDAGMSTIAGNSGVEVVLVGDSLGMTIQGHDSTLPVTMEHMTYHIAAVKRGNDRSFIIADMPFMSYATFEDALLNAKQLMQAGAHMVKMEGGSWLSKIVMQLSNCGIPVCAHLGLTPQSVNKLGGYRVQGREQEQANTMLSDARVLAKAGADLVVLECVPSALAEEITVSIEIITIGIGAGSGTDGQVLVVNDLLGMTPKPPKFTKDFLADSRSVSDAMVKFVSAVKTQAFPQAQHSFS